MTRDEFIAEYHAYIEPDAHRAKEEAARVNAAAEGFTVSAVDLDGAYALMADSAVETLTKLGLTIQRI